MFSVSHVNYGIGNFFGVLVVLRFSWNDALKHLKALLATSYRSFNPTGIQ